jgi:hypothetical protein
VARERARVHHRVKILADVDVTPRTGAPRRRREARPAAGVDRSVVVDSLSAVRSALPPVNLAALDDRQHQL